MAATRQSPLSATGQLQEYHALLGGPQWLASLRAEALGRFSASQWPTISEEEWRRTNLSPFEFGSYSIPAPAQNGDRALTAAGDGQVTGDTARGELAARVTFYNGALVSAQVDPALVKQGVRCSSLTKLLDSKEKAAVEAARRAITGSVNGADNRIVEWHYAALGDPAVIYVPRMVEAKGLFLVEFEFSGDEVLGVPHLVVVLEEGARAGVAKTIRTAEAGEVLVNDAEEIVLGQASRLALVTLQAMNDESIYFGNGEASVGRDAAVHRTEIALGADFVKARFVSSLEGQGADAHLNGIYFPRGEQHMDLRTVQKHSGARSTSRAFYRGAVRDESHSIYQGLIHVAPTARGTDAFLTNKNLILNPDARADSIPGLKISTDDVKCSHGSTTGKLDATQLFYLQSRGFTGAGEARDTLVQGYFEDLIVQCPAELQEEIRSLISRRLSD